MGGVGGWVSPCFIVMIRHRFLFDITTAITTILTVVATSAHVNLRVAVVIGGRLLRKDRREGLRFHGDTECRVFRSWGELGRGGGIGRWVKWVLRVGKCGSEGKEWCVRSAERGVGMGWMGLDLNTRIACMGL